MESKVSEQIEDISESESRKWHPGGSITANMSSKDSELVDVEGGTDGAKGGLALLSGTTGPYLRADGTIFRGI